jgi:hypothetical protein
MVNSLSDSSAVPAKALIPASLPDVPEVEAHPLLGEAEWLALRDSGIAPSESTEMVTTESGRREFLTGAWLLGLLDTIKPQMLQVVDVLNAGKLLNAVLEPRRSSKTTTLLCILLGRCYVRPLHYAGFTLATTQKKTAERYRLDVYGPITRRWPDPDNRPVKVYKGNGTERVEFGHGSLFSVLSPDGDAFRSGAYDTLLVDESGEASEDLGSEIKSAVLPSFDTRPEGQLIFAGTAAKFREGNVLWDSLHNPVAAVLRFSAPDTTTDEQLADWEPTEDNPEACVRALIEACHPGIGTLTTLERIEFNFRELGIEKFALEYLGIFGNVGTARGIVDPIKWAEAGQGGALPDPPERFGLAIAPHPDQISASIVAAWRDEQGKAVLLMLDHRTSVTWLASAAIRLSKKYDVPIVYDGGQQVALLAVEQFNRAKPRPRLRPMTFVDAKKAASLLIDDIDEGRVAHYRQPEMESAAKIAVKRKAGVNGWLLGRNPKSPNDDITPLEAASMALLQYDTERPKQARRKPKVVT